MASSDDTECQLIPDILHCVICRNSTLKNTNPVAQHYSVTMTNDNSSLTTFFKILEFSESDVEELESSSSIFDEFSSLLCSKCISRFQLIRQTFDQLELLEKQINYFRNEIQEEIFRRSDNGFWPEKKSDIVRNRIVEKLNLRNSQGLSLPEVEGDPNPETISWFDLDQNNFSSTTTTTVTQLSSPPVLDKEVRIVLRRIEGKDEEQLFRSKSKTIRAKPNISKLSRSIDLDPCGDLSPHPDLDDECHADPEDPDPDWNDDEVQNSGGDDNDEDSDCPINTEGLKDQNTDVDLDHDPEFSFPPIPPPPKKKKKTPEHLLIKCTVPGCTSKVRYTAERLHAHVQIIHEGIVRPRKKKIKKRKKDVPLFKCTYAGCTSKVRYSAEKLKGHVNHAHLGIIKHRPHLQFLKPCTEPGCTSKVRYSEDRLIAHVRFAHLKQQGPKPAQCDTCGKVVCSQKVLISHQRMHTGERIPCDICGAQFRTTNGLNDHKTTHAAEVALRPFVCDICGKSFLQKSNFNIHKRRHTGEGEITCKLCPRKFIMKFELDKHEKFAHAAELNLESIKCKICGKIYGSEFSLKVHKRTAHKGEFRYSCTECEYKSDRKHDLLEHKIKHSSEVPFKCDECGKCFKLLRRLKEHKRSHEDQHPFECSFCHKRFSKSGYLIKHELMHKEKG